MITLIKRSIGRPLLRSAFIISALACFALVPQAQAVVPAPDGGYPGGNTAEGQSALLHLSTGRYNTAAGFLSLSSNTEGNFNTAVGAGTLLANIGDSNTATGAGALLSNTSGGVNTATGAFALASNSTGASNTAVGASALQGNTTASFNTAVGNSALSANGGDANTGIGVQALRDNTQGHENTAVGLFALATNTLGNSNTAIGQGAGQSITGNSNICIGWHVFGVANQDNAIRIGDNQTGGFCYIGNIWNVGPGVPNAPVLVSDTGRLGVNTSSRRFKRDITAMAESSEAILALKPVTFHYKDDAKNTPCFGLIAEEVAEVNPDLILRDKEGKPFTVRYDQINAMLLNEFLKEHRKVQEQQATIAELKSTVAHQQERFGEQDKQIAALTSGLQKVSAQIEMSRPAPKMAAIKP